MSLARDPAAEAHYTLVLSAFPAVEVLKRLPDVEYAGADKQLTFHPLGIYNISRAKCLRAFRRVIDELDGRRSESTFDNRVELLLDAYEALLHALANHQDDCLTVLKLASANRENAGQIRKVLMQVIDEHFERTVRVPINKIKHHTHRIAPVRYSDLEYVVPGFFYVGAIAKGVAGPSPVVHRRGPEEHSLHLALRKLFVGMHEISAALAKAIAAFLPTDAVPLSSGPLEGDAPALNFIGEWFSKAPRFRFPGEHLIFVPDIRVEAGQIAINVRSQKPVIDCRHRSMRVTVTHTGDGATNSFRIPAPFKP